MPISDFHSSHITEVAVAFIVSAAELDPDAVTSILGCEPESCARRGDARQNVAGNPLPYEKEGWWRITTSGSVDSKDVNEHFEYLLAILLPHREELLGVYTEVDTYFDVLWKSSYIYAGTGPLLSPDVCVGVGSLRAGIGFDIYQVEEDEV